MEKGLVEIDINILDDYLDDGFAKLHAITQETIIYVEEYFGRVPPNLKRHILELVLDSINKSTFDLGDAKISKSVKDWESNTPVLDVVGLSHEKREKLVIYLSEQNLQFRGTPLNIYSES